MGTWRWGNVPLPERHLAFIGAGVVLGFILPWRVFLTPWLGHVIGWPLVVAGMTLAAWAVRAAGEVDQKKPASLIDRGPYGFSRNPMYLGWTLLYVGIALILNIAWLAALLPFVVLWTHLVVLREEQQLGARLGQVYQGYKGRVRRYL
jgi:protein-S-isoprenylcysteine O-methyltransferase Ste14